MSRWNVGQHKREFGEANRESVMEFFRKNPLAKQRDCAKALGLANTTVNRHVKELRAQQEREKHNA